jgi:hypothetical protein
MKKLSYLIILIVILGLVLTGCLSKVSQVPPTEPELPQGVNKSVDQDFYGWNLANRSNWSGDWTKGNLGKNWQEWDYVSYVLVLNGYGGAPLPEIDIAFDFYAANAVFVDLVKNFHFKIRAPYPGKPDDVTPGNFDSTWGGTLFAPTIINEPYPVGTPDNEVSPPGKAYWQLIPNTNPTLDGEIPPGQSVVIYFEARLAPSFIWQAGKGYVLDQSPFDDWGGDRYGAGNPDTDEWDTPHNGAGYTSGSSRHFYLESEGVGEKKVPIPIAELPGGEIHGSKFHDLNGNGSWDTATEPGLEGWTINLTLTVEGVDFTDSTTTASDGSYSFTGLPAGDYTISEVLIPGWTQTAPTPVPPGEHSGTLAAVRIESGMDFGNYQPGNIIVDKVTDPSGDTQEFEFVPSWAGNFSLADATTPYDSGPLVPGTYSVSEIVPAGWTLTSALCSDASDPGAIDLGPGETVTVTFTDTKKANIIVDKVTDPSDHPQQFEFVPSWAGNFSLADADTPYDSGPLVPGTYSVSEIVPATGWLDSDQCCMQ